MGMQENCPSLPVWGHMQKSNQAGTVAHGLATGYPVDSAVLRR